MRRQKNHWSRKAAFHCSETFGPGSASGGATHPAPCPRPMPATRFSWTPEGRDSTQPPERTLNQVTAACPTWAADRTVTWADPASLEPRQAWWEVRRLAVTTASKRSSGSVAGVRYRAHYRTRIAVRSQFGFSHFFYFTFL